MVGLNVWLLNTLAGYRTHISLCCGLNVCVHPAPIHVCPMMPNDGVGGRALGSRLDHEGGALMSGITALTEKCVMQTKLPAPSTM